MNSISRVLCLFKLYRQYSVCSSDIRALLRTPRQTCVWRPTGRLFSSIGSVELKTNAEVDVDNLSNGDPILEKKIKVLFLEVDILRQEGSQVPSCITAQEWKELISLETKSARKKFLTFCFKKEMKKNNVKKKKEEERLKRTEFLKEKKKISSTEYGLGGNTLFMRLRDSTMNNFFNGKLIEAILFGQQLVIDCGYDNHMTRREAKNCGKQLMLLFSENRFHIDPFNLYFCNVKKEGWTMKEFEKLVPPVYEPHFPLNVTEKSYLNLFPKERLVYLTPHCREELVEYDHNAVYIIGGLVDKVNHEPLSLARAKEQGIRMAKLPLDRYLTWSSGSGKNLTLNQMVMIMLDIKHTGDWNTALKHVPSRKLLKEYKIDYSADRFNLIENNSGIQHKPKDKYNRLVSKR